MSSTEEVLALRERVRELEAALGLNNKDLATTFHLTPKLNALLGLLMKLPNVTEEVACNRLGIATDIKVAIHRLRKHLAKWDIHIHSKRRLGYWIEPEDKERIRALVRGDALTPAEDGDETNIHMVA